MNDLIDTTEMYLRTVLDLEEEGITPLRARIAERLHQSGPTVSQTVARMERDGLVRVSGDRHLELTDEGRRRAISVMRKHRLAELLLVNVIGLEYEAAHSEACRWEHVMSDAVERKVYELLGRPKVSPYGNRIPGLDELDELITGPAEPDSAVSLDTVRDENPVVVRRISELLQADEQMMEALHSAGVAPGATVTVSRIDGGMQVANGDRTVALPREVANLVFVGAS